MKLLYCGGPSCDEATFKRLLIIAEHIAFMDRPSVTFGHWGTVGVQSPMRAFVDSMATTPTPLSVYTPPSGPAKRLYERYITTDLSDLEFRRVVLSGLASDESFACKIIVPDGSYEGVSGREIISALTSDQALQVGPLSEFNSGERMHEIRDERARRGTLRVLLTEASIHVTSAMLANRDTGFLPVTNDPFLSELLALRTAHPYVAGTSTRAPLLGLAVARAVIPDELLQQLSVADIVDYRKGTKDAYAAWSTELNSLAGKIDESPIADLAVSIPRLLASEIAPKLHQYENEMKSVRDKLFGDLLKKLSTFEVPTLILSRVAGLSLGDAAALFAGALLPAVPAIVDYFQKTAEVKRKHSQSYLIGLAKQVE